VAQGSDIATDVPLIAVILSGQELRGSKWAYHTQTPENFYQNHMFASTRMTEELPNSTEISVTTRVGGKSSHTKWEVQPQELLSLDGVREPKFIVYNPVTQDLARRYIDFLTHLSWLNESNSDRQRIVNRVFLKQITSAAISEASIRYAGWELLRQLGVHVYRLDSLDDVRNIFNAMTAIQRLLLRRVLRPGELRMANIKAIAMNIDDLDLFDIMVGMVRKDKGGPTSETSLAAQ
jgi:hypothetical protein